MIKLSNIGGPFGVSTLISSGLKLTFLKSERDLPCDISLSVSGVEYVLPKLACLVFDKDSKQFVPNIEVVSWGNDILVILGLAAWVIVSKTQGKIIAVQKLQRNTIEDQGFYMTRWVEEEEILLGIYESGVMAINREGEVVWQITKSWDDCFLRIVKGQIEFQPEFGGNFGVNILTGEKTLMLG
jgi:hypothetical protein